MTMISPDEYAALTRRDFAIFAERVFADLNPTTQYNDNFHIHMVAANLEAVRRGQTKRLIINVPPRSLKSVMASIAFPAWLLGHDPTTKIICASYGQELADDLARKCRTIMQTDLYKSLFPRTRLDPGRQAVHSFDTDVGGTRIATSVGGPMTGLGANIIIIDDPIKPEQAFSDSERKRANQWYSDTVVTRLNDPLTGSMITVAQRMHEDDFVAHISKLDDWKLVSFPAIAQDDELHVVETPYGSYTHRRAEGEALHPTRQPLSALAAIRRSQGPELFAAQYLQSPVPPGGGLIKSDWFRRYQSYERPAKFDIVVQSWDTANKAAQVNDPSVCSTWGVNGKDIYLLDILRVRQEYPDLKRSIGAMADRYNANPVLIEDKSSGTPLLQDLRRDGFWKAKGIIPQGDKILRMRSHTGLIEGGFVFIPQYAPWLSEYLHELMAFPNGRHDDQVDSTAQALQWFAEYRDEPGIIAWCRKQMEGPRKKAAREGRIVGVRGPTSSLYAGSQMYHVGNDGVIRIPWIVAQPVIKNPDWTIVEDNEPYEPE